MLRFSLSAAASGMLSATDNHTHTLVRTGEEEVMGQSSGGDGGGGTHALTFWVCSAGFLRSCFCDLAGFQIANIRYHTNGIFSSTKLFISSMSSQVFSKS